MSSGLTLKQKLQLFKLAKKPRRQIRLKLQVITNTLNLPSLKKSSLHKSSKNIGSDKLQKAMYNINNFKKIDRTKHNYQEQFHKMQEKQNGIHYKQRKSHQYYDNNMGNNNMKNREIIKKTIYHPNDNRQFLLKDFRFDMRLSEKMSYLMDSNVNNIVNNNTNNNTINNGTNNDNNINSKQVYKKRQRVRLNMTTFHLSGKQYRKHAMLMTRKISPQNCQNNSTKYPHSQTFHTHPCSHSQNIELLKLKNEYNSLRNINRIYHDQLSNTFQIQEISMMNNNKITQMMIATNEEFKHQEEMRNSRREM